ncbi:MAG: tRNA pseudouridine(55) synthase TruB [Pyrinomonadaceae bacterium MAG19_C2-C3]|nr:tRNA pseudouridine(55) synthase TruB [Pyrinomonadaceae bacterium MAG19_C2-C3]
MSGILILDKPAGVTSHDCVSRVRRIYSTRRVGHTGTLDPFATGVLVMLLGHATRLAQFLATDVKEYQAVIRFGFKTATGDLTGARIDDGETLNLETLNIERIKEQMLEMTGVQTQTPPMYSAKKIDGVKLYELARQGIEVERKAVEICVSEFELMEYVDRRDAEDTEEAQRFIKFNDDGTCDARVRVVCSAGTYIRVLAEDLGARLNAGAHLVELRRTRAGAFDIHQSRAFDELARLAETGAESRALLGLDDALPELPRVPLGTDDVRRVHHGASLRVEDSTLGDGAHVRLTDDKNGLVAVGIYDGTRQTIQPRVLLVPQNDSA